MRRTLAFYAVWIGALGLASGAPAQDPVAASTKPPAVKAGKRTDGVVLAPSTEAAFPLVMPDNALLWSDSGLLGRPEHRQELAKRTCAATIRGQSAACTVSQIAGKGGAALLFSVGGLGKDVDRVALTSADGTDSFEIRTARCSFSLVGPLKRLHAGASLQVLWLHSPNDQCLRMLEDASQMTLRAPDGTSILATKEDPNSNELMATFQAGNLPATLPLPLTHWSVEADGFVVGKLEVQSDPPVAAAATAAGVVALEVAYDDALLNKYQNGSSTDGVAVATNAELGDAATAWNRAALVNVASLNQDARLLEGATDHAYKDASFRQEAEDRWKADPDVLEHCDQHEHPKKCATACNERTGSEECGTCKEGARKGACAICACRVAREEWIKAEAKQLASPWRIRAESWESEILIGEAIDGGFWWQDVEGRAETLNGVEFATGKQQGAPFRVTIRLVDPKPSASAPGTPSSTVPDTVLFSTSVVLAQRARFESLPLPIAELMFVACGEPEDLKIADPFVLGDGGREPDVDSAINGSMRAVDDSQLESGACWLFYEPDLYEPDETDPTDEDALSDFGPQEIVYTVSRDGVAEETRTWTIIDPAKRDRRVIMLPQGSEKGTGPYRIRAQLNGAQHSEVVYRPARAQAAAASSATPSLGSREFAANLRPRGPTGWRFVPLRTFVTFPVQFVGLRMPARGRELHSSSESSAFQIFTPKVGIMLAAEPWDYDTGSNPLPVPMRFMSGLHLIDLSEGGIAPSLATGFSFTFPILDLPSGTTNNKLGTDIALGAFWEVDLQEKYPFRDGNRAIVTIGLNVLSLFGSK